jgi:hypothetical protein
MGEHLIDGQLKSMNMHSTNDTAPDEYSPPMDMDDTREHVSYLTGHILGKEGTLYDTQCPNKYTRIPFLSMSLR